MNRKRKVFDVKPYDNFDVIFRLAIYKTRKEMLSAIEADVKKQGGVSIADSYTMGMFRLMPSVVDNDIPGTCYSDMFGAMYLNLADATDEIVIHECAHAAFAWEYNIRHYAGTFDDDDGGMDEQEAYCYFLGRIADIVMKTVKDYKRNGKGIQPR